MRVIPISRKVGQAPSGAATRKYDEELKVNSKLKILRCCEHATRHAHELQLAVGKEVDNKKQTRTLPKRSAALKMNVEKALKFELSRYNERYTVEV